MDTETIFGQVIAKANSYQVGNSGGMKHIIKNERIRAYERTFASQCRIYRGRMINCKFGLIVTVYQSSMRFDLDNSIKTLLDCLQQVRAITDDNLCISIQASKRIDRNNPRVVFAIQETEPRLI